MSATSLRPMDRTHSENCLVAQRLKRHDPELLDQLIVEYRHSLLRYLLYLTGDREVAEDLFQETWMRVLRHGAQFNGNSRFATWLFTIARNLVYDMRRRRRHISSLEATYDGDNRAFFEITDNAPSPLDRYQAQEKTARVAKAMLSLEPSHREVLLLYFHSEFSLKEIARITQMPLSTVKSRLYRGLAAIKRCLRAIKPSTAH